MKALSRRCVYTLYGAMKICGYLLQYYMDFLQVVCKILKSQFQLALWRILPSSFYLSRTRDILNSFSNSAHVNSEPYVSRAATVTLQIDALSDERRISSSRFTYAMISVGRRCRTVDRKRIGWLSRMSISEM